MDNQTCFKPENFKPDWIRINIEGEVATKPIIEYLEQLDYINKGPYNRLEYEMNDYEYNNSVFIRKFRANETPDVHWTGTTVDIPSKSAAAFYSEMKKNKINWKIFSNNGSNNK